MEIRVGTLANYSARELAERAADHVMGLARPHAVCLDPRGRVSLEPFDDAVIEDVVGVYTREPGLVQTYKAIRDDLEDAIAERGIVGTLAYGAGAAMLRAQRAA